MKGVVLVIFFCIGLQAQVGAPKDVSLNPAATEHIRELIASLPKDCDLRSLLEAGQHGDGVSHTWMKDMKSGGVSEARFMIQFVWDHGPEDLKVQSATYFSDYCQRPDGKAMTIGNGNGLSQIIRSGLGDELNAAALSRAKDRLRKLLEQAHWNSARGNVLVVLTADEWVPALEDDESDQIVNSDFTPLMDAAIGGEEWLVRKLLKSGAAINAQNGEGWTALMYAADHDRLEIAQDLLRAGADATLENIKGDSALSIAARQHYVDIVALLKEAGAR